MDHLIGEQIDNYLIRAFLDEGGTAVIYQAVDTKTSQNVALKILKPDFVNNPAMQKHFRDSASKMEAIMSSSVAQIFGQGTYQQRPYLTMEYLDGGSLRAFINQHAAQNKTIRVQTALGFIRQIAEALDEIHQKGLVHGDIKPGNILFRRKQGSLEAVLIDLNANDHNESGSPRMASAPFMSPEHYNHEPLTQQSDIYSLGVVSYQLLTGWLPYQMGNNLEDAAQHADPHVHPRRPQELNPQLWPIKGIDTFLEKALAKRPIERYRHVHDFLRALTDMQANVSGQNITVSFNQEAYSKEHQTQPFVDVGEVNIAGRLDVHQTWDNGSYRLLIGDLWNKAWVYPLTDDMTHIRIGRAHKNELILVDEKRTVSKVHAQLSRNGSQWFVEDLGSENGIYQIRKGQKDRLPRKTKQSWEPDAVLQIGPYFLKWQASRRATKTKGGGVVDRSGNGRSSKNLRQWNPSKSQPSINRTPRTAQEYNNLPQVTTSPPPSSPPPIQPTTAPIAPIVPTVAAVTAGAAVGAASVSPSSSADVSGKPYENGNFMNGAFIAQLNTTLLAVDMGQAAACTLTLVSKQLVTDNIELNISGLPAEVQTYIEPQKIAINPRGTGEITITLALPDESQVEAGTYPLELLVSGNTDGGIIESIPITLRVGATGDFALRLLYSKQPEEQPFQAVLVNDSNATQRYTVEGKDDENALKYKFQDIITSGQQILYDFDADEKWIEVPPGVEQTFAFEVSPRNSSYRNKFLRTKSYPFHIRAKAGKSSWQQAEGQVETQPVFTRSYFVILVISLVLCGILSAASIFGYGYAQTLQATATANAIAQLSAIEQSRLEATANAQQFASDMINQPDDEVLQALATQSAQEMQEQIDNLIATVTAEATLATELDSNPLGDLSEDPVNTLSNLTLDYLIGEGGKIPEDTAVNTVIGQFAVDIGVSTSRLIGTPEPPQKTGLAKQSEQGNNIVYTLVQGDEMFRIVGNELQLREQLDFETNTLHFIRVRADNLQGSTIERQFRIEVTDIDDAPRISIVELVEVNERRGTVSIKVELDRVNSQQVSVDYITEESGSNTSATSEEDYEFQTGTITWEVGDPQEKTITIEIIDDEVFEQETENFFVLLSNAVGGVIVAEFETATINITDNDSLPELSVEDNAIAENNTTIEIPVTFSGSSAATVSVRWETADISSGNTATNGEDYTGDSGELTWNANESGDTKYIRIDISEDEIYEGDELFEVILSEPENATIETEIATITIEDDDPLPAITVDDNGFIESIGNATVVVNLSRPSSKAVTVKYATTDEGSAKSGADFEPVEGELTWEPGDNTPQTFDIAIVQDSIDEDVESITVRLSGVNGGDIEDDTAEILISDSDGAPQLRITDASVNEGDESVELSVEMIGGNSAGASVSYVVQPADSDPNAANIDTDVIQPTGNTKLTWAPDETNATKTFTIEINNDVIDEPTETFEVLLNSATGAFIGQSTAIVTINDDDDKPVVSILDAQSNESNGEVTLTIRMTGGSHQIIQIGYATQQVEGGDATLIAKQGIDYTEASSTLTWDADTENEEQTITITLIDDIIDELEETFEVALTNDNYVEFVSLDPEQKVATVTINDNDLKPRISIVDRDITVNENDQSPQATVELCLTGGSSHPITLNYFASEDSTADAADYESEDVPVSWNADEHNSSGGCESKNVIIDITEDDIYEREDDDSLFTGRSETLVLDFVLDEESSDYVAPLQESQATITIDDQQDPPPLIFFVITNENSPYLDSVMENEGPATVAVQMTGQTEHSVQFGYTTNVIGTNTTHAGDSDFTEISGTDEFLVENSTQPTYNTTFDIPINNDPIYENDEIFQFILENISPSSDARFDANSIATSINGTILIGNDEDPPAIAFSSANQLDFNEAPTRSIDIDVILDRPSSRIVTATYEVDNSSTAVEDIDYELLDSFDLTWPANVTTTQISIQINNDDIYEDNETLTLNLIPVITQPSTGLQQTYTILSEDPLPIFSVPVTATIREGSNNDRINIQATLSRAHTNGVTVTCQTNELNPAEAVEGPLTGHYDYEGSDTLTFSWAADEIPTDPKVEQIVINDDLVQEGNEQFTLDCSTDVGSINNSSHLSTMITIEPDGDRATIETPSTWTVNESEDLSIPITLTSGLDSNITLNYRTSPLGNTGEDPNCNGSPNTRDYVDTSRNLSWLANEDGARTVTVEICGNNIFEDEEEGFTLTYTVNPTNTVALSNNQTTVYIDDDDDKPTLSVDNVTIEEADGNSATLTLNISGRSQNAISGTFSVSIANNDTAENNDFADNPLLEDVAWSIPAFSNNPIELSIPLNNENVYEGDDETFTLSLEITSENATFTNDSETIDYEISIVEATDVPQITIVGNNNPVPEGSNVSSQYSLAIDGECTGEVIVRYTTSNGTARHQEDDYDRRTNEEIEWDGDEDDKPIDIPVRNDDIYEPEPHETFTVDFQVHSGCAELAPGAESIMVEIANTTPIPEIRLERTSEDVNEGAGANANTFEVSLSGPSSEPVTVNYHTLGITADPIWPFNDYVPVSSNSPETITWNEGESGEQWIIIGILDDFWHETDETFDIILFNASSNATLDQNADVGRITIIDNDSPPDISMSSSNANPIVGNEGVQVEIVVELDRPSWRTTTVDYEIHTDGPSNTASPDDYEGNNDGSITIDPEETEGSIFITIADDDYYEGQEQFTVRLTGTDNGTIDNFNRDAIISIPENDNIVISMAGADIDLPEGNTDGVEIVLTGMSYTPIDINYTISGSTADNNDYNPNDGSHTLTIPAHTLTYAIPIVIEIDGRYELAQDFDVVIVSTTDPDASINNTNDTTTVTIPENDFPAIRVQDGASTTFDEPFGTSNEETPHTIQFSLSNETETDITFTYTFIDFTTTTNEGATYGTATSGDCNYPLDGVQMRGDYFSSMQSDSVTLSGNTPQDISITIRANCPQAEIDERFILRLTSPDYVECSGPRTAPCFELADTIFIIDNCGYDPNNPPNPQDCDYNAFNIEDSGIQIVNLEPPLNTHGSYRARRANKASVLPYAKRPFPLLKPYTYHTGRTPL